MYVFEGPDGVGKSVLAERLRVTIEANGVDCVLIALPGKERGTLGRHIYRLHHDPKLFDVETISPTSRQLLHVSSHIDAIENRILPALEGGVTVILDRFWWSVVVYGTLSGVPKGALDLMIQLEYQAWNGVTPTTVFLIDRDTPLGVRRTSIWHSCREAYRGLANQESGKYPIEVVNNNRALEDVVAALLLSSTRKAARKRTNAGRAR